MSKITQGNGRAGRTLRLHHVGHFELESGHVLEDVVQAYHLDGKLNHARDNLVVLFHSLTGTPDAVEGWWQGVVGPGLPIDTDRYAVLCTNLLGSCYGTTGLPQGPGAPAVTTRDMVRLVRLLVAELGVREVALATGGSLGGMAALEWAASFPELSRSVVAFAAPAAHTAHAIGLNHVQRRAIELAGDAGLELAREIAMLTYRTPTELEMRFGRERREEGPFQVQSYLDHQGAKLSARMDTGSYLALIDAMDSHDVGRERGGSAAALRAFRGRLFGVGVPGDMLYPEEEVRGWVTAAGGEYRAIHSVHGHDAFLLEARQASEILREALEAEAGQAGETGKAGEAGESVRLMRL